MSYQPTYNAGYPPPAPYPSAPGYDQYQQGPPPPPGYTQPPPQYSQYPQQQYGPPQPQYGPPQGGLYTQQPNTVYVYQEDRRRDKSGEECFLWGLCAACLCCCLLND